MTMRIHCSLKIRITANLCNIFRLLSGDLRTLKNIYYKWPFCLSCQTANTTPLFGPGLDSSTNHCTSTARSPSRLADRTWDIRSRSRRSQSSATGTPRGCGIGGGRSAWGRTWRSRMPAAGKSRWGTGGPRASDPKGTSWRRRDAGARASGWLHAALLQRHKWA